MGSEFDSQSDNMAVQVGSVVKYPNLRICAHLGQLSPREALPNSKLNREDHTGRRKGVLWPEPLVFCLQFLPKLCNIMWWIMWLGHFFSSFLLSEAEFPISSMILLAKNACCPPKSVLLLSPKCLKVQWQYLSQSRKEFTNCALEP